MKSQYEDQSIAGARRRDRDGSIGGSTRLCIGATALMAIMLAMPALSPAVAQAPQRIALASPTAPVQREAVTVTQGQSQDVQTGLSIADIIVSDPAVAVVSPLTDQSFSILGKKIGATRVTAYDQNRRPVKTFDVQVTPEAVPGVTNAYDLAGLRTIIAQVGGGGIRVSEINKHLLLSGTAPDSVTLDRAVEIARQFDPNVIDTVAVLQQQQVELDVRFIEVDRQAGRELGVQWNYFGNSALANIGSQQPATSLPITQPNGAFQQPAAAGLGIGGRSVNPSGLSGTPLSPVVAAGVLSGAAPFGFLVGQLSNRLQVEVNALEQRGLARMLAEPNLVTLSGDTASFLAGGQIPIPAASGLGTVSFAMQPYGVGLSFTPTVLRGGLINLVIKPEVSEIDSAHSVTVLGTSVPGLITRKASTTLELRDGQSFMLGGLLQNTGNTGQDQLPWLGNLPVLGALFRSSQYQKNETDLVILVTPHIVRPLPPTARLHTPFDGSVPGNDIDFFLMGKAEVSPALIRLAAGAMNRPYVGDILDLPKRGGVYVSARD